MHYIQFNETSSICRAKASPWVMLLHILDFHANLFHSCIPRNNFLFVGECQYMQGYRERLGGPPFGNFILFYLHIVNPPSNFFLDLPMQYRVQICVWFEINKLFICRPFPPLSISHSINLCMFFFQKFKEKIFTKTSVCVFMFQLTRSNEHIYNTV